MPKFTLIAEHTDNSGNCISRNTHEFEVDFLDEVLENMDQFIRGTGFFPSGVLNYAEENFNDDFALDPDWDTLYTGDGHEGMGSTLDDYPELREHKSEFYFDTQRNK